MAGFQSQIIVHPETFDASGISDHNRLDRALMSQPDQLTPVLTALMGGWNSYFPLLTMTEGQVGGTDAIPVNNIQYQYPVIGKPKTTEKVVRYDGVATSTKGKNFQPMFVVFPSAWFPAQASLRSQSGKQARVAGEPIRVSGGYRYELQHFEPDEDFFFPDSDFAAGAIWGRVGGTTVSESRSIGNSNPVQNPGKRKNQISVLRESYRYAGNIANKTVEFQLANSKGGTTSLYLDWENYQHMLNWRRYKEEHYWTSRLTRDEQGRNPLVDARINQPIPVGAGMFQQIPNKTTYSTLTERLIRTVISDVFRGAPDTGVMDIVLYHGTGFAEEFDYAMKDSNIFKMVAEGVGTNFVRSAGGNLQLGGYFKSYQHIDGHIVTLKKLPMLDHGGYADASPRHPVSGLPMSSYEAHFIDHSRYDNVPNVRMVYEKGRMEVRGIQQGMSVLKESTYGDFSGMDKAGYLQLATEQDETSIHYLCTGGVQMLRDSHSFSLLPDMP